MALPFSAANLGLQSIFRQPVLNGPIIEAILNKGGRPKRPPSPQEDKMPSSKLVVTAALCLAMAAFAEDNEKKLNRADLPPAVEKTVAAQSQGATIKGFSQEKENGQIYYEAEMMVSGHSKDVTMSKDGSVVEVEEQVAFDSLPDAVKESLQSKAGKGKIVKVESLTKHDKVVAYEAKVQANGKKNEIQVGPDGKPLDHEE